MQDQYNTFNSKYKSFLDKFSYNKYSTIAFFSMVNTFIIAGVVLVKHGQFTRMDALFNIVVILNFLGLSITSISSFYSIRKKGIQLMFLGSDLFYASLVELSKSDDIVSLNNKLELSNALKATGQIVLSEGLSSELSSSPKISSIIIKLRDLTEMLSIPALIGTFLFPMVFTMLVWLAVFFYL